MSNARGSNGAQSGGSKGTLKVKAGEICVKVNDTKEAWQEGSGQKTVGCTSKSEEVGHPQPRGEPTHQVNTQEAGEAVTGWPCPEALLPARGTRLLVPSCGHVTSSRCSGARRRSARTRSHLVQRRNAEGYTYESTTNTF